MTTTVSVPSYGVVQDRRLFERIFNAEHGSRYHHATRYNIQPSLLTVVTQNVKARLEADNCLRVSNLRAYPPNPPSSWTIVDYPSQRPRVCPLASKVLIRGACLSNVTYHALFHELSSPCRCTINAASGLPITVQDASCSRHACLKGVPVEIKCGGDAPHPCR